ncbi:MAG: DUF6265 family protein [Planctomycetota bacterium]
MSVKTLISIGAMALTAVAVWAKPPSEGAGKLALSELSWMAGRWQSPAKTGYTDEHWAEPRNGAMNGMCRIGDDGKRSVYEILLIEEVGDKLEYSMMHFGPGLKPREKEPMKFDVERGKKDKEVVFVGRDKEKPARLTYSLASPDQLVCVLEKMRDGKQMRDEFRMNRVSGK